MAKKRIGDIASAHDLNPKEVVKQLQEAGFSVQSPTSTIDERRRRVRARDAGEILARLSSRALRTCPIHLAAP